MAHSANRQKLAVIFGGCSSEHSVSLLSATSILKNLNQNTYEVYPIGITKSGEWFLFQGELSSIADGSWERNSGNLKAILSPDRSTSGLLVSEHDGTLTVPIDVIFPVLHGKNGEDGTIQGLFELSGIPYVGCGTLSSATCMDKAVTHTLLTAANIEQTNYLWFYYSRFLLQSEKIKTKISARLTYPLFVKPANSGSSIGISRVDTPEELDSAVHIAGLEDTKILVENAVLGKEVECAVLGNSDATASVVGEIGVSSNFYDYDDKYINGTSKLIIPANIEANCAEQIRKIAVRAHRLLGCRGLSRVDFFVTKDNKIILNEINTMPGFTSISMYSKLWENTGISNSELLDTLISCAMNKKLNSEKLGNERGTQNG